MEVRKTFNSKLTKRFDLTPLQPDTRPLDGCAHRSVTRANESRSCVMVVVCWACGAGNCPFVRCMPAPVFLQPTCSWRRLHSSAGLGWTRAFANMPAGFASHSCPTAVCVSGPCMLTVSLPYAPLQLAGAAAVGRTGRSGRVLATRFAALTSQDAHRVCCHRLQNATEDLL